MFIKRVYLLIPASMLVMGCFKKPEQEGKAVPTTLAVVPYAGGISGSYLIAQGSCNGNPVVMISWSSALTPLASQDYTCTNGSVNVHLPIQAGTSNQIFTVNIYGRFQNKKSAASLVTVNFNPGPPPVSGHALTVAGGAITGPSASTWSAVGEVFGGTQRQSDPSMVSRSGISGVLDP